MTEDAAPVPSTVCAVAHWLESRDVGYRGPMRIPLDRIDERESKKNQARPEALIPEIVDRYSVAMKKGDKFPPIVVYVRNQRLVIIDGNNRVASARKAGVTEIMGYAVDLQTSSEMIALLTVEANAKHGTPTTNEWRVHQALDLVKMGVTQEMASDAAGLRVKTLQTHVAAAKADERAKVLVLKTKWGDLPVGSRARLNTIRDDAVFVAAANCVIDNDMPGAEVDIMVRDIRGAGSEADRLEVVSRMMRRLTLERATKVAVGKQGRSIPNAKMNLTTGIGKVMGFDVSSVRDVFRTSFERAEIYQRCEEAVFRLMEIQEEITRLTKAEKQADAS